MTKSLKVCRACFLGGGIGTLSALQINGYFWWLGMLIGGLIGYLSYESRTVLMVFSKTWKNVVGRKPYKENLNAFLKMWWYWVNIAWTLSLVLVVVLCGLTRGDVVKELVRIMLIMVPFSSIVAVASLFDKNTENLKEEMEISIHRLYKRFNPISFFFWNLPKWFSVTTICLAKGLFYIISRTPVFIGEVTPIIGCLIKTVFIMIHSDIRLLCGIDAAIGAIIGYLTGDVIIGAIAGGMFGVLNYEIISKRILHLNVSKPKTPKKP